MFAQGNVLRALLQGGIGSFCGGFDTGAGIGRVGGPGLGQADEEEAQSNKGGSEDGVHGGGEDVANGMNDNLSSGRLPPAR